MNWPQEKMYGIGKVLGALALFTAAIPPAGLFPPYAAAVESTPSKRADFAGQTFSTEVHHIADWAVRTGDHERLPFIVVDKVNATAAAFDRSGKLLEATPVLVGIGVGDKFPPGVAALPMHQTRPSQRITPAGRYFAEEDLNLAGETVLWVDYDAGVAIHKLSPKRTKQRRHERIVSPDPAQHRITYGCINVPPAFYDRVVHPHFRDKGGMVYVLPDSTPLKTVFRSYDAGERRLSSAGDAARPANSAQVQRF
jgi:hypothetical protein